MMELLCAGDMFANHAAYHALGFDHIEDLSGTWGVKEGHSGYTQHLQRLGLLSGLQEYLAELEPLPDQQRRFVAEALPLPAEEYIDAYIGRRVAQYVDDYSADDDRPSFVYCGFQGPHEPWDSPDEIAARFPAERLPAPIPELRCRSCPGCRSARSTTIAAGRSTTSRRGRRIWRRSRRGTWARLRRWTRRWARYSRRTSARAGCRTRQSSSAPTVRWGRFLNLLRCPSR